MVYSGFVTSTKVTEKSIYSTTSLGTFEIFDRISKSTVHEQILKRRNIQSFKPLASVVVETNPPSGRSDLRVGINMEGVDIIVNVGLIQRICKYSIKNLILF